jgi:hypothetical protein
MNRDAIEATRALLEELAVTLARINHPSVGAALELTNGAAEELGRVLPLRDRVINRLRENNGYWDGLWSLSNDLGCSYSYLWYLVQDMEHCGEIRIEGAGQIGKRVKICLMNHKQE